jgi:LPXTG-motif cell wall-anchored protein
VSNQDVNGGDYGYGPATLVLPATGFDPLNLLLSAAGLILLGIFLMRRRERWGTTPN